MRRADADPASAARAFLTSVPTPVARSLAASSVPASRVVYGLFSEPVAVEGICDTPADEGEVRPHARQCACVGALLPSGHVTQPACGSVVVVVGLTGSQGPPGVFRVWPGGHGVLHYSRRSDRGRCGVFRVWPGGHGVGPRWHSPLCVLGSAGAIHRPPPDTHDRCCAAFHCR